MFDLVLTCAAIGVGFWFGRMSMLRHVERSAYIGYMRGLEDKPRHNPVAASQNA